MKAKKLLSTILSFALVLSLLPVSVLAADFGDTDGHWAETAIGRWSGYGVVNGVGNGDFDPNGNMTRAQAAQVFTNLLGLKSTQGAQSFSDVPAGEWYSDAIAKVTAAGIMNGVGGGRMNPNAPVTREQFFVMFARAIGLQEQSTTSGPKADGASWSEGYINALTDKGFVKGTGSGVNALADINRASVMSLLDQTIGTYANTSGETVTGSSAGVTLVVADDVTVTGNVDTLVVAEGAQDATGTANVTLDNATVEQVNLVTETALSVEGTTSVEQVNVSENAEGTSITGAGEVAKAEASTLDVTVETPNTEVTKTETTENADGSTTTTVAESKNDAAGKSTGETKTETTVKETTAADGTKTTEKTATATVTNAAGKVTETTKTVSTVTEKTASDGTKTTETAATVTKADGTGKVVETTKTESTVKESTAADGTKTTETAATVAKTDAAGKTETTKTDATVTEKTAANGTKTTETAATVAKTDASGKTETTTTTATATETTNANGSVTTATTATVEKTAADGTKTTNKVESTATATTNADGSTTTAKTETVATTDASGKTTTTKTESTATATVNANGTTTTATEAKVEKTDASGKTTTETVKSTETAKENADGSTTATTTTTTTDASGRTTTTTETKTTTEAESNVSSNTGAASTSTDTGTSQPATQPSGGSSGGSSGSSGGSGGSGGSPTVTNDSRVKIAKLHDNTQNEAIADNELYTSYTATATKSSAESFARVTVSVLGLKAHLNDAGGQSSVYPWMGFSVLRSNDTYTKFKLSYQTASNMTVPSAGWTEDANGDYQAEETGLYSNAAFYTASSRWTQGAFPGPYWVKVEWFVGEDATAAATDYYYATFSGTYSGGSEVVEAKLHDNEGNIDDSALYTDYRVNKVAKSNYDEVTVTAANLKPHKNDGDLVYPWVGFAVKAPDGANKYKVKTQTAENDTRPSLSTEGGAKDLDKTIDGTSGHDGYVSYTARKLWINDSKPDSEWVKLEWYKDSNMISTEWYKVVYDVTYAAAITNGSIGAAHLEDHAQNPVNDLYTAGSYIVRATQVADNIVDVTIRARNVASHTNGQGQTGNWVGFYVKAPGGATGYTYATSKTEQTLTSNTLDPGVDEASKSLSGVAMYYNAANITTPQWFSLQWTGEGLASTTTYYYVHFDVTSATTNP